MVIIATWRTLKCRPRLATVSRAISSDSCGVDDLFVTRIDVDFREVTAAGPRTPVSADAPPRFTRIVRAIDATELRRIDSCINSI